MAYPSASEICYQSYEGSITMDPPDWASSCEILADYEYDWAGGSGSGELRYYGEFEPNGPVFESPLATGIYLFLFCPMILSIIWLSKFDELEEYDDGSMYFLYWNTIFNSIMILVTISALIYNLSTLPELNDYTEGNSVASHLLSEWDSARSFHYFSIMLSWCFICMPIASLLARLGDSTDEQKMSGKQIKQVKEVKKKLSFIQPHVSESIVKEIESDLVRLNSNLESETIRNRDLNKIISQLQTKINKLEKDNPQIKQNVNITINDSVVMDTTFDNSINNKK